MKTRFFQLLKKLLLDHAKSEIYVSTDVETDGSIPGPH
jgi:hypothetical protein